MPQPRHCQSCGREFAYGNVLFGSSTLASAADMPMLTAARTRAAAAILPTIRRSAETCRRISFGYEGTKLDCLPCN